MVVMLGNEVPVWVKTKYSIDDSVVVDEWAYIKNKIGKGYIWENIGVALAKKITQRCPRLFGHVEDIQ